MSFPAHLVVLGFVLGALVSACKGGTQKKDDRGSATNGEVPPGPDTDNGETGGADAMDADGGDAGGEDQGNKDEESADDGKTDDGDAGEADDGATEGDNNGADFLSFGVVGDALASFAVGKVPFEARKDYRVVKIKNTSSSSMSGLTSSGTGSGAFKRVNTQPTFALDDTEDASLCGDLLEPSESCQLVFEFDPFEATTVGTQEATSVLTFTVEGGGTGGEADERTVALELEGRNLRHQIFVTSASYTGDLGGMAGADEKCNLAAAGAGLPGYWKAVLSDLSAEARGRIALSGPVYNLDPAVDGGQVVAEDYEEFWNANGKTLKVAIKFDETGAAVTGPAPVWSASAPGGEQAGSCDCENWTSLPSTSNCNGGFQGDALSTSRWLFETFSMYSSADCSTQARLYCISQETPKLPDVRFPPRAHRIFATSTDYTGNLGGFAGADAKCQERAAAANLGGTWKAVLSNSGDAFPNPARTKISGAVYNLNPANGGDLIAVDAEELRLDFSDVKYSQNRVGVIFDEAGQRLPPSPVWTGSGGECTHCLDWTVGALQASAGSGSCWYMESGQFTTGAVAGKVHANRQHAFNTIHAGGASALSCNESARLYCIDGQE